MTDKNDSSKSGVAWTCLLMATTLFILLKMTGNIDWSWWWVFCPMWLPFATVTFSVCLMVPLIAVAYLMDYLINLRTYYSYKNRKREQNDEA